MIDEPATSLTDYAIALQSLLLAIRLLRFGWIGGLWAAAFGSVSLAAGLGGTYHGFARTLSFEHQIYLWQGILMSLTAASFWVAIAAIWETGLPYRSWLTGLLTLKLTVLFAITAAHWSFAIRIFDYLITLGTVLMLYTWQGKKKDTRGLTWLTSSVVTTGFAALVLVIPQPELLNLPLEAWYHLIQMVGLYCLYRSICDNSWHRQNLP